ncbi:MAG: DUF2971 domain-containing protein [Terracidiphilus sp.]
MEEQEQQPTEEQAKPEGPLYHYTDQKGLLGIIHDKCIWATHVQYLNDTSEGKIVSQAVFNELCSAYNTDSLFQSLGITPNINTNKYECVHEEVIGKALSMATWATTQNSFVTSFSMQGNLLSQWRAYSGKSVGYSIGFEPSYLIAAEEHFKRSQSSSTCINLGTLARCVYYDEKEKQLLQGEIESLASSYFKEADLIAGAPVDKGIQGFKSLDAIALKHFISLGKSNAITKDYGFYEEEEWRFVFLLNQNSIPTDLKFRVGSSMLIPYLEIPLRWEDQRIEIKEIIIGPCPHPDDAIKSVEMLLKREGIPSVEVKGSKIPYRNG